MDSWRLGLELAGVFAKRWEGGWEAGYLDGSTRVGADTEIEDSGIVYVFENEGV